MYAHEDHHVKDYLEAVDRAFSEISEADQKGDIKKRLKGSLSSVGFKRLT